MYPTAFIQNLSSFEIILIFLVVLLFFGAKRLPDLFRSFGKSLREFKKATTEIEDDIRTAMDEDPKPATPKERAKTPATTTPREIESDAGVSQTTTESDSGEKQEKKESSQV